MKLKKTVAMLLVIVLTLSMVACGKAQEKSETGASADGKKVITVWAWDDNYNVKAANEAKKIYEANHNDVTVKVVSLSIDDIVQKLNTSFAAGNYDGLPNVVLIEEYRIGSYMEAFPGTLRDLSAIVNPDDWMQYKLGPLTNDGKIYGVPFDSAACAMFYRTDLLEQAGYTAKDLQNITWDQYIAIGKKVKEKTGSSMLQITSGDLTLMKILMQSAGTWYVKDDNVTLNIQDNAVMKKALETYKALMDSGIVLALPNWDAQVQAIQDGKLATIVDGSWISATIKTAADQSGKWAVAPIPRMDGVTGATNASNVGGASWYVIDKVPNADIAESFLGETFASNTELLNQLVIDIGLFSSHIDDGSFTNYDVEDSFYGGQKIWKDIAAWAVEIPTVKYGINTYNIDSIVEEELQGVYTGADIDKALTTIESRAEQISQ